jgi:hypothetical protein
MSSFGDDGSEMPRPGSFDDDAIDALLAGNPAGQDAAGVSSFIEDLRTAAEAVPTPSPALAAAITAGGISTHQPNVAQWRKWRMKIQGFVAGLGIAGKLALGVGVAAAATTSAGAAGVLPGPVQHAVSDAVGAVTPFSIPDGGHHDAHDGNLADGDATTTTTVREVTTTTLHKGAHDGDGGDQGGDKGTKNGDGDGGAIVVTPTTVSEHHGDGAPSTTTTVAPDNGSHDNTGPNQGTDDGNDNNTTPTTVHHGDGDNNNPESLTIQCVRSASGPSISCTWSAATASDHASYVLLRIGDGDGRVPYQGVGVQATDYNVVPGVTYGYRVDSLRADGSVSAHSGLFNVLCCGDAPATTTTTISGDHH